MSRTIPLLALAGLLALTVGRAAPSDDDPVAFGKNPSEWFKLLEKRGAVRERRAAARVLGTLGGKVPGVVPALWRTLRKDADAEVRQQAAQALRDMGPQARDAL